MSAISDIGKRASFAMNDSSVVLAAQRHYQLDQFTDERIKLLKQYGTSSLSYSSLQDGLDLYIEPDHGYIAYSIIHMDYDRPICLADPICSAEYAEQLLKNFMEKHKGAIFIHTSKETAKILNKLGFLVNEIGTETIIDVNKFTTSGGSKEFLRSQINRAKKDGLTVKEQRCSDIPKRVLEQISAEWMVAKANIQELSFLVRPAIYENEIDVRKYFAYKDDKLIGFSFFDPIYSGGKIIGYLDNIHRSRGNFSYSIPDCILLYAMQHFKDEGKEILSLGYSPLYSIDGAEEFKFSNVLQNILKHLYDHGNFLYDFKGTAFHKTRYRPGSEGCKNIKVYCACESPLPILHLDKVLQVIGIDPIKIMAERSLHWGELLIAHSKL